MLGRRGRYVDQAVGSALASCYSIPGVGAVNGQSFYFDNRKSMMACRGYGLSCVDA